MCQFCTPPPHSLLPISLSPTLPFPSPPHTLWSSLTLSLFLSFSPPPPFILPLSLSFPQTSFCSLLCQLPLARQPEAPVGVWNMLEGRDQNTSFLFLLWTVVLGWSWLQLLDPGIISPPPFSLRQGLTKSQLAWHSLFRPGCPEPASASLVLGLKVWAVTPSPLAS